jgi:hypothetical protein
MGIERICILTPSPGLPPLVKTRDAVHPLPQGGEGMNPWALTLDSGSGLGTWDWGLVLGIRE